MTKIFLILAIGFLIGCTTTVHETQPVPVATSTTVIKPSPGTSAVVTHY